MTTLPKEWQIGDLVDYIGIPQGEIGEKRLNMRDAVIF